MEANKRENLNGRKVRIKAVAEKVLAGKDGKSVGAAMREVGYSENYADNPQKLTKSKTWKELMKEFLPDDLIAETHHSLLKSATVDQLTFKPSKAGKPVSEEFIEGVIAQIPGAKLLSVADGFESSRIAYFTLPEGRIRKEAVEMAYKLRGRFAAEKIEVDDPYDKLSNGELAAKINKLKAHLLKKTAKK